MSAFDDRIFIYMMNRIHDRLKKVITLISDLLTGENTLINGLFLNTYTSLNSLLNIG